MPIKANDNLNKENYLLYLCSNNHKLKIHSQYYYSREYNYKYKNNVFKDTVLLMQISEDRFSYQMTINREIYSIKDKIITTKTMHYLTNIAEPMRMDLLRFLYETKIKHWQVETWHKVKDMLFLEDRYYKGFNTAIFNSIKFNLLSRIARIIGLKLSRQTIKALKYDLILALRFYLLWINRTILKIIFLKLQLTPELKNI